MTIAVQTVQWQTIFALDGTQETVALVPVNFATDTVWNIYPFGSIIGVSQPGSINANYILVDNIANVASITIEWGPFSFTIPAFTRARYLLTKGNPAVKLTGTLGTVNVYFLQTARIDESVDYYGIQVAATRSAVTAPFGVHSTASTGPNATILFNTIDFDPTNSFNTTTHAFTAPAAGYISLCLNALIGIAVQNNYTLTILKNAAIIATLTTEVPNVPSPPATYAESLTVIDDCAIGDVYTARFIASSVGATVKANSTFQGLLFS